MLHKVATIQMRSENDDYDGNCSRAAQFIAEAVDKRAQLILLPEFALIGYIFDEKLWEMAEELKGRTYRWLKTICINDQVYIGTCILERDGTELYDTFILVGPGEEDLWSHRKIEPASLEACFFKGAGLVKNLNVFDTPLRRIGVAICFDTTKTHTVASLRAGNPELLLIPFSCPGLPERYARDDAVCFERTYLDIPHRYAEYLDIPVVTSNKTGRFSSPVPGFKHMKLEADFIDTSMIIDPNRNIESVLTNKEGVLVEEIEISSPDAEGIKKLLPESRWFMEFNKSIRSLITSSCNYGRLRYMLTRRRRMKALTGKE